MIRGNYYQRRARCPSTPGAVDWYETLTTISNVLQSAQSDKLFRALMIIYRMMYNGDVR